VWEKTPGKRRSAKSPVGGGRKVRGEGQKTRRSEKNGRKGVEQEKHAHMGVIKGVPSNIVASRCGERKSRSKKKQRGEKKGKENVPQENLGQKISTQKKKRTPARGKKTTERGRDGRRQPEPRAFKKGPT